MVSLVVGFRHERGTHARGAKRRMRMPEEKKAMHVNPVGENWEVEDEKATLGQAETQPEAIELAAELATEARADEIRVHSPDGLVEKEIKVNPAADRREAKEK